MIQKSYENDNSSCLYLVPTPIGNLEDITLRALNVLKSVDLILCEDTRDTALLLSRYDIKNKLLSCHEYNEKSIVDKIISLLENGMQIALVTDQGTPIISDPGYYISKQIINRGFSVISLPGATAFVPALTSSGIEPSPFLFYGFLNSKKSKQIKELEKLKNFNYTLIFYESVHRISDTLENMLNILGNRNIAICRELSKIHEEICRDKISNLLPLVSGMKGEFVIIVEGNKDVFDFEDMDVVEHVKLYLDDGITEKEAIKKVAKDRLVSKAIIYKEYHERKKL